MNKRCFVIAPIGQQGTEIRDRSDKILKYLIEPIAIDAGYEKPIRADHISKPGVITSQIIERIVEDELVIADLTDENPNVFYELAIRHALKKPCIQLIRRGDKIPFDVSPTRTINIDHTDLDSVENAKIELKDQIIAIKEDPNNTENPISMSLDLRALRLSSDPEKRSIAELNEKIAKIQEGIGTLNHNFGVLDRLEIAERTIGVLKRVEKALIEKNDSFFTVDEVADQVSDLENAIDNLKHDIDRMGESLSGVEAAIDDK